MQDIFVSIIIPIYKVEPYIVRCIDSVLSQTYRQLEVILVDDCTPDRSMEIAREHIEKSPLSKDLRFVYLKHDHNRGLSAARNTGMDAAKGEYIYFLDSDDEITEDCISTLVCPLYAGKFDCVIGDIIVPGSEDPYFQLRGVGLYDSTEEIARTYLCGEWYPMAWNKLCRNSYLKKNSLYFKEGLIHEDELWSFQLACTLQTLYAVNKKTYIYNIRPDSIITANTTRIKTENYLKVLKGMYFFQEEMHLTFKEVEYMECKFRKSVFNLFVQHEHFSLMHTYILVRKADVRSMITKKKIYKSTKERILNFDLFLPAFFGFIYKYTLWRIRNYRVKGHIPFY